MSACRTISRQTVSLVAPVLAAAVLGTFHTHSSAANPDWHPAADTISFAIVGDYGLAGQPAADVASLIKSWDVDFIATVGDNNYPSGSDSTIDANVGQYYSDYIYPYVGSYSSAATENRFFPALGNHDWMSLSCTGDDCTGPYFDYFTLPGNERYYDFVRGDVHLFILDSQGTEPDGTTSTSRQAEWLRDALASSTAAWQVVLLHHAPYSGGRHGSQVNVQWPFADWGVDVVVAGHDHLYERFDRDGIVYVVNGMGGRSVRDFLTLEEGSVFRYNGDYGAMRASAGPHALSMQFYSRAGTLVDHFELHAPNPTEVISERAVTELKPTLRPAYPDPARSATTISYVLPYATSVHIAVFDILGREVRRLRRGLQSAGRHQVTINVNSLRSGLYFYRLETDVHAESRRLIVVQ